jgi:hypothetical protein
MMIAGFTELGEFTTGNDKIDRSAIAPDCAGVYLFILDDVKVVYVGVATNLAKAACFILAPPQGIQPARSLQTSARSIGEPLTCDGDDRHAGLQQMEGFASRFGARS